MTYYKNDLGAQSGALGKPLGHVLCVDHDSSWEHGHQEFYDAVVYGRPVLYGTVQDAVRVMALVEKFMRRSAEGLK